ncbi:MAG: chemotaxis protein CheW [Cellvibrionales bacterium]|nr:chemotaxis protein CheW [Cellvibrionales bacterium]
MPSTAFDHLVEIVNQATLINPELPSRKITQESISGIGFNLLSKRLFSPLNEIVEMLEVPEATKLPGVHPWVLGIANFRGKLLPLFDLSIFFNDFNKYDAKKKRVLVIELGDLYAGIIVNEVYGMVHLPSHLPFSPSETSEALLNNYSTGCLTQDGVEWQYFSPFELAKDPRFFNAAKN